MVCKLIPRSDVPELRRADRTLDPDPNRLVEEFYPVIPSLPSTREERRTRLGDRRGRPLPQLQAQVPIEPALSEGATTTVLRPGESHKIYAAHDILGTVSGDYALVIERAARWCDVEDSTIYAVVERFERRFMRWKKKKDKLQKDLEASGSEGEASEEAEE